MMKLPNALPRPTAMLCRLLVGALILLHSLPASAETSEEALKKLEAAIQTEVGSRKSPQPDARAAGHEMERPDNSRRTLMYLRQAMRAPESQRLDSVIDQLASQFQSEEVQKAIDHVAEVIRSERKSREAALRSELDGLFKRTSETVRAAKKPQELDDILRDLRGLREKYSEDASTFRERRNTKLDGAEQFVARWQEYLSHCETGDFRAAQNDLQNLSSQWTSTILFVPRSEILSRIQQLNAEMGKATLTAPEEVGRIMAKTKTLDDVPSACEELQALQVKLRPIPDSSGMERSRGLVLGVLRTLRAIDQACRAYNTGATPALVRAEAGSNVENVEAEIASAVFPLQNQLTLLILPRYLGVPAGTQPKPGEGAMAFTQHILNEARERGDSALIQRCLITMSFLGRSQYIADDAVKTLQAAQNQEAVGQYDLAVLSYMQALRSGSDLISPKYIGERLGAIRKDHPEAYEAGMDQLIDSIYGGRVKRTRLSAPQAAKDPAPASSISPSSSPAIPITTPGK